MTSTLLKLNLYVQVAQRKGHLTTKSKKKYKGIDAP